MNEITGTEFARRFRLGDGNRDESETRIRKKVDSIARPRNPRASIRAQERQDKREERPGWLVRGVRKKKRMKELRDQVSERRKRTLS